jgi:hypothetical protein
VRDGTISAEEGEKLKAAVKSDPDVKPAPVAEEPIRGPRMSRLAIAGALGPIGAIVVAMVAYGIGSIFGARPGAASEGAACLGGATVVVCFVLSIIALVAIRMRPTELSGKRLAVAGIVAPVVCVVAPAGIALAKLGRMARRRRAHECHAHLEVTWRHLRAQIEEEHAWRTGVRSALHEAAAALKRHDNPFQASALQGASQAVNDFRKMREKSARSFAPEIARRLRKGEIDPEHLNWWHPSWADDQISSGLRFDEGRMLTLTETGGGTVVLEEDGLPGNEVPVLRSTAGWLFGGQVSEAALASRKPFLQEAQEKLNRMRSAAAEARRAAEEKTAKEKKLLDEARSALKAAKYTEAVALAREAAMLSPDSCEHSHVRAESAR